MSFSGHSGDGSMASSRMARVGVVLEYQVGVRWLICNPSTERQRRDPWNKLTFQSSQSFSLQVQLENLPQLKRRRVKRRTQPLICTCLHTHRCRQTHTHLYTCAQTHTCAHVCTCTHAHFLVNISKWKVIIDHYSLAFHFASSLRTCHCHMIVTDTLLWHQGSLLILSFPLAILDIQGVIFCSMRKTGPHILRVCVINGNTETRVQRDKDSQCLCDERTLKTNACSPWALLDLICHTALVHSSRVTGHTVLKDLWEDNLKLNVKVIKKLPIPRR